MTKTFEEEFPSMINDESALEALGASDDSIQDVIMEYCLDKQRVKEKIEELKL